MADIRGSKPAVFRINTFTGLDQSPAGDAALEKGRAAEMVNFRITGEGALQVRPGTRTLWRFDGPVEGLWSGSVGGKGVKLAAAGEHLWLLGAPGEAENLGYIGPGRCVFFPFGGRLYLLTPQRYMVWTGYGQVTDVAGYRPVVVVSVPPEGGGETLEGVNLLTGARRGFFSPDGHSRTFCLPETQLTSVDYVVERATGEHLRYSANLEAGTVTLTAPPPEGANTLEIGWTKGSGQRGRVTGMACCELFSGGTDNRIFLYGNGTNQAVFSGVDYDGAPCGAYFPEGNVVKVGDDNTPVTGIIRHYSRLLCFKPEGAWAMTMTSASLENGIAVPALTLTPIQREVGHTALGQVSLVGGDPWTLWNGGVYRWKPSGEYLAQDERTVHRVSGRVEETLREMELSHSTVFDDRERQEWYLTQGEVTAVYNLRRDAWYLYRDFPARCYGLLDGELHIGTQSGQVRRVSPDYRGDDGAPIHARWRSGSMTLGCAHRRKWSRWLWLSMKPESGGAVTVSLRSDRGTLCPAQTARALLMNYRNVNYGHWSFRVNRQPQVIRLKLRPGPAACQQIVLESNSASETATVAALEWGARQGRYV